MDAMLDFDPKNDDLGSPQNDGLPQQTKFMMELGSLALSHIQNKDLSYCL